jgi:hypothetical protein
MGPSSRYLLEQVGELAELRERAKVACEDARLLRCSQRRMLRAIREEMALGRTLRTEIRHLTWQRWSGGLPST